MAFPQQRRGRFVYGAVAVALIYMLYLVHDLHSYVSTAKNTADVVDVSWIPQIQQKALVPLEAHIMSKCPDARDGMEMLVLPSMQKVYDKVNFTLSFIGT